MSLVSTEVTGTAPLTLTEAQEHLRYLDNDQNDHIESLITAATDWAERWTQRTLRVSVSRVLTLCEWWKEPLILSWPPITAVSSVTYYDADNASQTLGSSNYEVRNDTDGTSKVWWSSTAVLPALYNRQDAVTVTYLTGYAAGTVPATVKQAIGCKIKEFWGQDDGSQLKEYAIAAERLLGTVEWPRYA